MPVVESLVEEFRLDNEDLQHEQFIVAEEDGRVVGFGRTKPYQHCFELGCVGVRGTHRNRSVGSAIVERLIRGFPSDDIWITTDIPDYFERFGFQWTQDAPDEISEKIRRVCQRRHHPGAVIMLLRRQNSPFTAE